MSEALNRLRKPFPDGLIGKLPKPTRAQTDAVKANPRAGMRCALCSSWHHPDVVHLDYIGHAAVTQRLLDADLAWAWEPLAYDGNGLPLFDAAGGLWGKLTVCGVTRLGYGNADKKPTADAGAREKEVIGDFLRNAAMRFGVGLDLWHKGDLYATDESLPRAPTPNSVPLDIPTTTAPGYDSSNLILKTIPFVESAEGEYKYVRRADAPSIQPADATSATCQRPMAMLFNADGSTHSEHATMGGWLDAFEALAATTDKTLVSALLGWNAKVLDKIATRGGFGERISRIHAAMDAAMDAATLAQQDD